jgi:hypothetical protein
MMQPLGEGSIGDLADNTTRLRAIKWLVDDQPQERLAQARQPP